MNARTAVKMLVTSFKYPESVTKDAEKVMDALKGIIVKVTDITDNGLGEYISGVDSIHLSTAILPKHKTEILDQFATAYPYLRLHIN